MSKYNEMQAFYEKRIDALKKERDQFHEKYTRALMDNGILRAEKARADGVHNGKVEVYEQLLKKLMGERNDTDCYFTFEGKVYRAVDFDLSRCEGSEDRLMVTFVLVDGGLRYAPN